MPKSRRAAWACALGMTVLSASALVLVAQTSGQDNAVKQTSGTAGRSAIAPAVVGSIDMEAVFKGYKKVEFLRDEIEVEAKAKQQQLAKMVADGQQVVKEMESLQPGSEDFKALDAKLTTYRVQLDSAREQAQKEFAEKEAKALATIYKEVEAVVKQVAVYNHMTYVVRVSNEPVSGSDPNSVMAAMSRSVVYSDPGTDITEVVIRTLNHHYQASNPGRAAPAQTQAAPAPAPARAPAPAPRGR